MPQLSERFEESEPSAIRLAQQLFDKRARANGNLSAINVAIGDISSPTHPKIMERMHNLGADGSPFRDGVVRYGKTVGEDEARQAYLKLIEASGGDISGLHAQTTNGGTGAMIQMMKGCLNGKPLLGIEPLYANYFDIARDFGKRVITTRRQLQECGKFTTPDMAEIDELMKKHNPGAVLTIPADNPTGQFMPQEVLEEIAKLCVKHDTWLASDEAYRGLHYTDDSISSIWNISEDSVPGISGRRLGIESASKGFNYCGGRSGALVTDNELFHQKSVDNNTAYLCANVTAQYAIGALAHESTEDIRDFQNAQCAHYREIMAMVTDGIRAKMPDAIMSNPDAAIYSVVDFRNFPDFNSEDFVHFCATRGVINIDGEGKTLLAAPMQGFYKERPGEKNPGDDQIRIAHVLSDEEMAFVPELLTKLFEQYKYYALSTRGSVGDAVDTRVSTT